MTATVQNIKRLVAHCLRKAKEAGAFTLIRDTYHLSKRLIRYIYSSIYFKSSSLSKNQHDTGFNRVLLNRIVHKAFNIGNVPLDESGIIVCRIRVVASRVEVNARIYTNPFSGEAVSQPSSATKEVDTRHIGTDTTHRYYSLCMKPVLS